MSRRSGFTYLELLCVMAIILAVWALLIPCLAAARARAEQANCLRNMDNLAWALRMYAQDHSGQMPPAEPGLKALTPRYLHDGDVYRCPGAVATEKRFPEVIEAAPPGTVDYVYRAGLADDDHPVQSLLWDSRPRHRGGGNVLYLSGEAKWVDAAALAELDGGSGVKP